MVGALGHRLHRRGLGLSAGRRGEGWGLGLDGQANLGSVGGAAGGGGRESNPPAWGVCGRLTALCSGLQVTDVIIVLNSRSALQAFASSAQVPSIASPSSDANSTLVYSAMRASYARQQPGPHPKSLTSFSPHSPSAAVVGHGAERVSGPSGPFSRHGRPRGRQGGLGRLLLRTQQGQSTPSNPDSVLLSRTPNPQPSPRDLPLTCDSYWCRVTGLLRGRVSGGGAAGLAAGRQRGLLWHEGLGHRPPHGPGKDERTTSPWLVWTYTARSEQRLRHPGLIKLRKGYLVDAKVAPRSGPDIGVPEGKGRRTRWRCLTLGHVCVDG